MSTNAVVLIQHDPVNAWDYDPIQSHFRKHNIRADQDGETVSRLLWRGLTVAKVCDAIRTSQLSSVSLAAQAKWCDAQAASELSKFLGERN